MKDFVVKSGDNVYDFKVIPYIRVKSPKVEKNGNVITATFSLEAGKQEVKLKEIQLFAFSDMWVGNNVKLTLNGGTDKQVFSPSTAINSADIYTLSIDLGQNADVLKYSKNYYFRIGALADVSGVGTVRHNYAPVVVIKIVIYSRGRRFCLTAERLFFYPYIKNKDHEEIEHDYFNFAGDDMYSVVCCTIEFDLSSKTQ